MNGTNDKQSEREDGERERESGGVCISLVFQVTIGCCLILFFLRIKMVKTDYF